MTENLQILYLCFKQLHLLLTFYQIMHSYHDIIVVVRNRYLCELTEVSLLKRRLKVLP